MDISVIPKIQISLNMYTSSEFLTIKYGPRNYNYHNIHAQAVFSFNNTKNFPTRSCIHWYMTKLTTSTTCPTRACFFLDTVASSPICLALAFLLRRTTWEMESK